LSLDQIVLQGQFSVLRPSLPAGGSPGELLASHFKGRDASIRHWFVEMNVQCICIDAAY